MTSPLRSTSAWQALAAHADGGAGVHLRELFAADPDRAERLTGEAAGLFLDYSKNRVTDETLRLLVALAEQAGVAERRDAMFAGERINVTEDRSVLHVALRMPRGRSLVVDGVDVVAEVHEVLDRMGAFADAVRSGEWKGRNRASDQQRRQHRHRRLRSRAGDGLQRAASLQPARHDLPLRLERRRHRLRRGDARPRSCGDAVHRLLEDVHDARDDDERDDRAGVAARRARRRRVRGRPPLRRRLDEPRRMSRSSGSTPPTRSGSGTGSAAATRWTPRSASRRCSPSARTASPDA